MSTGESHQYEAASDTPETPHAKRVGGSTLPRAVGQSSARRPSTDDLDRELVQLRLDIDEVKRAQVGLQESGDYARAIVDTIRDPLLIVGADLRVKSANQSFYFILLDIGLPLVDGHEVASRLRRENVLKDSFIIAISGYGEGVGRGTSDDAVFDHYLVKPVNYDDLLTLIDNGRRNAVR